jgi:hypothetical protein
LQIKGKSCNRLPKYKIGNINYPALDDDLDNRQKKVSSDLTEVQHIMAEVGHYNPNPNVTLTFDNITAMYPSLAL